MRKRLVIALGIAGLAAAVLCLAFRLYTPAIHLFTWSITVIVAVVFESWGYLPKVNRSDVHWQATGERFHDPVSGKPVEVFYDPASVTIAARNLPREDQTTRRRLPPRWTPRRRVPS